METVSTAKALEIMDAFRTRFIPGTWKWELSFPGAVFPIQTLKMDYNQFSVMVWSLYHTVNNTDLMFGDRKGAYGLLGFLAESVGVGMPFLDIPGYSKVTVEECR